MLLYTVYHSYLSECQDRKNTLSIKTIVKYGWNWGENSSKEISTLSEPVFVSYEIAVSNDSNLEPQKKFGGHFGGPLRGRGKWLIVHPRLSSLLTAMIEEAKDQRPSTH